MPTYVYRCSSCEEELEVVQSFTDEPLTLCPNCDGELRKVFHPVGVVFKGSGFYKTDNRSKKPAASAQKEPASEPKAADSGKSPSPRPRSRRRARRPPRDGRGLM